VRRRERAARRDCSDITVAEAVCVVISNALSLNLSVAPDLTSPGCPAKLSKDLSVSRELDKKCPRSRTGKPPSAHLIFRTTGLFMVER